MEFLLKSFAKKILSQKTSLALIAGYDIDEITFEAYLKLMELNYKESIIKLGSKFSWGLTENWEKMFPFIRSDIGYGSNVELPPIHVGINIEPNNSNVLADISISEMKLPLIIISEKGH